MLIWFGASAVAAVAIAWLAAMIHASGHAPIGLVSVGVGLALGATLSGLAARQQIACTRRVVIGTVLIAVLTVFAEHAWLYLDFRRQWSESREKSPQVAMFRSESPLSLQEYFRTQLTPQRA